MKEDQILARLENCHHILKKKSVLFSLVTLFSRKKKFGVPDNTGWMQFRNREREKTMARLETASATSGLLVKGTANTFLRARISTENKMPKVTDDMSTTKIENWAAFGLPAPSSFDILTLSIKKVAFIYRICENFEQLNCDD
jgi:hypothetical protein